MEQNKLSPNVKLNYSDVEDLIEQYLAEFNFNFSEIEPEQEEKHITQTKTKELPLF